MRAEAEAPIVEVIAPRSYASKVAVVQAIGAAMVAAGAVTGEYVEAMLQKESGAGTIVAPEVALPHGTSDARAAVRRNILVVAPITSGVEWTSGKTVRLAIGFAGRGDDAHLRLMGAVARVLSDATLLERLKNGADGLAVAEWFE